MEDYRGRKIRNIIDRNLKVTEPEVLDIGCGLNNLYFNFKNYIGMDINDYGLENKVKIIKQDFNENLVLPFDSSSFDLVIVSEFLEHIFRPDLLSKEINRVVKDSGVIIVTLPNEFTLNCRLGFMFNKVLNKGFDLFTHKYIFNVKKIDEFIKNYFKSIDKDFVCYGVFWNFMPDFVNDLMVKVSPRLFAKSVIFVCRKKEEKNK
ncbi:MAG: class I SAM-dependent methyltransferase [Patescibacteria group bacterium]